MRSLEYISKNMCSLKRLYIDSKISKSSKRLKLGSTLFRNNKYKYAYNFSKSFSDIAMSKDEEYDSLNQLSYNNESVGIRYYRINNRSSTLRSKL